MNPAQLPNDFTTRMQHQLGPAFPAFLDALAQPAPVSIRLNPKKNVAETTGLTPVPWCPDAFYLNHRPVFTLDPLFQAGAYYVQEASSMLLAEALRQHLPPYETLRCLDLCAAPGGKTTLLASALPENALLVANEVIRSRVPVLKENMQKWGNANVVIANHDPADFAPLAGFFDVVLVDAPCSGEGLFRKDPAAVQEWSEENVALCAARQQRILQEASTLVSDGGILIYSTCTYNEEENEQNARFLQTLGFATLPLALPDDWNVVKTGAGYQCYPHRLTGEGFFISVFRQENITYPKRLNVRNFHSVKPAPGRLLSALRPFLDQHDNFTFYQKPNLELLAIPKALEKDLLILDATLRQKGFGVEIGEQKGQDIIPAHALALSNVVNPDLPALDLTKDEALRYFKKENPVPAQPVRGWLLMRYAGLNLGWGKGVGGRVNNYLPGSWRIRMDIPEWA